MTLFESCVKQHVKKSQMFTMLNADSYEGEDEKALHVFYVYFLCLFILLLYKAALKKIKTGRWLAWLSLAYF